MYICDVITLGNVVISAYLKVRRTHIRVTLTQ